MLNVVVDSDLQQFDFKSRRVQAAQTLEAVRQKVISANISYDKQFNFEIEAQRHKTLHLNFSRTQSI